MKVMKKVAPLVALAALASATVISTPALAEMSAGANISTMYFWRGKDISDGAPALSGSVDWSDKSGAYAGIWTSSEGHTAGTETDFYVGYAGESNGIGYDVSLVRYQYPEAKTQTVDTTTSATNTPITSNYTKASDASFEEVVLGVTYQDFGFKAYVNTDSDASGSYKYYSFNYGMGNIGLHAGITSNDSSAAEYKDFNVSYAITDKLTGTVSKASGDGVKDSKDDMIFVLSLDLPIGKMN